MRRSMGSAPAARFGVAPGPWELGIASASAAAALLGHALCRLQAAAGSPICTPLAGTTLSLPCVATGAIALIVGVAAAKTWLDALHAHRIGHAG